MKLKATIVATVAGLSLGSLSHAATYASVLRVNMTGEGGGLSTYSGAGVLDTTTGVQWQSINGLWATPTNHNVTLSGYTITMSNEGGAALVNPTIDLFDGYARWTTSSGTMTISGLNPSKVYDFSVFASYGWHDNDQAYTVSDFNGTSASQAVTGDTTSSFIQGDNYVVFTGIVPKADGSFTLNLNGATGAGTGSSHEVTLSGFELGEQLPVPEPSVALLCGIGALGLLRRRR